VLTLRSHVESVHLQTGERSEVALAQIALFAQLPHRCGKRSEELRVALLLRMAVAGMLRPYGGAGGVDHHRQEELYHLQVEKPHRGGQSHDRHVATARSSARSATSTVTSSARQRRELVPRPRGRLVDGARDRERPLLQRRARRRTRRQDREAALVVLTGRDPRRIDVVAAAPAEATRDRSHGEREPGDRGTARRLRVLTGERG
jgi:hypothetical protein